MYQQSPPYPSGSQQGYDPSYDAMLAGLKKPSKKPWLFMFLTMAAAGGAGYWGWGERQRLLGELKAANEAASEAVGAKKAIEERAKSLETEKIDLASARDALKKDVDAKSSELAELKGTYDKLQEKMKDEIAQGDVQISQSNGKLRVDLVDKILFESGDAHISKRGEGVLTRVGSVLAGIDDKQIQVSGHTDNNPISDKLKAQYPTNWELSVARATNVVRVLAEQAKVPPERLVASGYGEYQPVGSNKTPKGRARNRRIELLLTFPLQPKLISKAKLKEQTKEPSTKAEPAKEPAKAAAIEAPAKPHEKRAGHTPRMAKK